MEFKDLCRSQLVELARRDLPDEDSCNADNRNLAVFEKLKDKCGSRSFSNDDFECTKGLSEIQRKNQTGERAEDFVHDLTDYLGNSAYGRGNFEHLYYSDDCNPNAILHNAGARALTERMIQHGDEPLWKRAFSNPEECGQVLEVFVCEVQNERGSRSDMNEKDCLDDAVESRLNQCRCVATSDFHVMSDLNPAACSRQCVREMVGEFYDFFEDNRSSFSDAISDYDPANDLVYDTQIALLAASFPDHVEDAIGGFGKGISFQDCIRFGANEAIKDALYSNADEVKFNLAARAVNALPEQDQEDLLKAFDSERGGRAYGYKPSPLALRLKEIAEGIENDQFTPETPKLVASQLVDEAREKLGKKCGKEQDLNHDKKKEPGKGKEPGDGRK